MFINTKSADQFAEHYAAKQKAQEQRAKGGSSAASSPPKKPAKKSLEKNDSSESAEHKTASTWLSERNKKLRKDAITTIQDAITEQEKRNDQASNVIESTLETAKARLQSGNERGMYNLCMALRDRLTKQNHPRVTSFFSPCWIPFPSFHPPGAVLSMKKLVGYQAVQEQISETIEALEKLFLDIGSEDVKPEGHEKEIKQILALPLEKKTKSDIEMLTELKTLMEK
jgi:hypothetical protein